ncbi:hypothetical protein MMC28_009204 [Mycoblastus sanguinarius]|nr:hypothetical protein [Mycoblastus sanguinarius]
MPRGKLRSVYSQGYSEAKKRLYESPFLSQAISVKHSNSINKKNGKKKIKRKKAIGRKNRKRKRKNHGEQKNEETDKTRRKIQQEEETEKEAANALQGGPIIPISDVVTISLGGEEVERGKLGERHPYKLSATHETTLWTTVTNGANRPGREKNIKQASGFVDSSTLQLTASDTAENEDLPSLKRRVRTSDSDSEDEKGRRQAKAKGQSETYQDSQAKDPLHDLACQDRTFQRHPTSLASNTRRFQDTWRPNTARSSNKHTLYPTKKQHGGRTQRLNAFYHNAL